LVLCFCSVALLSLFWSCCSLFFFLNFLPPSGDCYDFSKRIEEELS
jgi:hypothetical protein